MALTKATYRMFDSTLISVKDFGAVGDGVTNDAPAIQAAINALSDGGELRFESNKTYLVESGLTVNKSIRIIGNKSAIKGSSTLMATNGSVLMDIKNRKSTNSVSVSIPDNDNVFTIPSGVSVEAGDMVLFTSTDIYRANSVANYYKGQWVRIDRVDGTTAYTAGMFLIGTYTATTMEVYKPLDKTSIYGLQFDLSLTDESNPLLTTGLSYIGAGILVDNCDFKGNSNAGVALRVLGENANITNSTFSDFLNLQGIGGSGRLGYGVSTGSNGTNIRGCFFNDCKHSCTASVRTYVTVGQFVVDGCTFNESYTTDPNQFIATLDTHVGLRDRALFINNTINCLKRAFAIANGRVHIHNNVVNNKVAGIVCITIGETLSDFKVTGNKFSFTTGTYLFQFDDYAVDGVSNLLVAENTFTGGGLILWGDRAITIKNVIISNNSFADSNVFLNIDPTNDSDFKMENWIIENNRFSLRPSSSADRIIKIASSVGTNKDAVISNININNNYFDASKNTDLGYIMVVTNVVVTGMKLIGNEFFRSVDNGRGVKFDGSDLENLIISNNTFDETLTFQSFSDDCDYDNVVISNNTMAGISISEGSGVNIMTNTAIKGNTLSGVIARYGSGHSSSDPIIIEGNFIRGGTTFSVLGEKMIVINNVLEYEYSNSTYYYIPRNKVLNGTQSWSSGSTVDEYGTVTP